MLAVRPEIEQIYISGRTRKSAEKFLDSLDLKDQKINISAPEETAACDLICSCTSSTTPVIPTGSVKSGAHLNLIGSFSDEQKEADSKLIQNAEIFVDHRTAAKKEAGELISAEIEGIWSFDQIIGDFSQLVQKKASRSSSEAITLFKSVGLASWDLIVAETIYRETN